MAQFGTYSPTLGWYVFGPLSAFLWEPALVRVGSSDILGGPGGPYEWWYLSTTPDMEGIFAVGTGVGIPGSSVGSSYVGPTVSIGFTMTRTITAEGPYLVVYTPYSSYLAVLQLPIVFGAAKDSVVYIAFQFQNRPLN